MLGMTCPVRRLLLVESFFGPQKGSCGWIDISGLPTTAPTKTQLGGFRSGLADYGLWVKPTPSPLCIAHKVKSGFVCLKHCSNGQASKQEYAWVTVCILQHLKYLLFGPLQKQVCRLCYGLLSFKIQYILVSCYSLISAVLWELRNICRQRKIGAFSRSQRGMSSGDHH